MRKIVYTIAGFSVLLVTGCLKDKPSVDFSNLGTVIELLPPQAGLENFSNAALIYPFSDLSDDQSIVINVASPSPPNKSIKVTIGVIDSARVAYNGSNGADYAALPDSAYSIPASSGTIAAGKRLDTLSITFYPSKIDTTVDYMLPVGITDAQGQTISGNFGIIFFHFDAR